MAQFDIYKNRNPKSKSAYPYIVDIQSDLLSELRIRVVVPATKLTELRKKPIKHLTPVVDIEGSKHLLLIPQLAGISIDELGKAIGDLSAHRQEIVAAVDFLVTGV